MAQKPTHPTRRGVFDSHAGVVVEWRPRHSQLLGAARPRVPSGEGVLQGREVDRKGVRGAAAVTWGKASRPYWPRENCCRWAPAAGELGGRALPRSCPPPCRRHPLCF
eukprot:scaffold12397_cov124-Isochrysis_galbana.AAC.5